MIVSFHRVCDAGIEPYIIKNSKDHSKYFLMIKERYLNCMHGVAADRMWSTVKSGLTNSDTQRAERFIDMHLCCLIETSSAILSVYILHDVFITLLIKIRLDFWLNKNACLAQLTTQKVQHGGLHSPLPALFPTLDRMPSLTNFECNLCINMIEMPIKCLNVDKESLIRMRHV